MRHTAVAKTPWTNFSEDGGRGMPSTASIPASVKGWDTVSGLAEMPPNHAVVMDNWIPRTGWLEVRRGFVEHATGMTEPVETIMDYTGLSTNELFAVANDKIWDVTVAGAAVDTLEAVTNNRFQFTNFTNENTTTNYLVCGNGVDDARIYDGSTWANLGVTFSGGYSVQDVIQPHGHQGRLWFVLNGSSDVAYLPLGAIAGAATNFPLGSFMTRGGYVMAMTSWTVDTRQTVSDYAVFITSRGQVIVFMGTDPETNWSLVGVYDIGPPIGRRCFVKVAGDVGIISIDGILPLSQVLSTDRTAANRVTLTNSIAGAMFSATQSYSNLFGWQIIGYPKGNLVILNIPQVENETAMQFVMETNTGGWCRFLGIDANCWGVISSTNSIFFGGNDGTVYQFDVGSGDGDLSITATIQTAFNYHGSRGQLKNWTLIRPIITSDGSIIPGVALNVDFKTGATVPIPEPVVTTGAQWDVSLWDVALWPQEGLTTADWHTVSGTGQCVSVITTVSTLENGTTDGVLLQLNGWDMAFEKGGLI